MSQYAKEIKHILATLNEQEGEDNDALPDEEDLDTIHVYPVEGGGILFTRTPLEPNEAAPPIIDSQDDQTTGGLITKSPPLFVLFLLLLCLFVVGDVADTQLIALMTPTATITIVPQTHIVTATAGRLASRGHPCARIRAAHLVSVADRASDSTGHQDAQRATGSLTFSNGLFTPQYIAQGTVFTGSDGIQVATDAGVSIPANTPPVDGQATVWAQAVLPGHHGNVPAGDITATIGNGVLVKNSPFRGGQDERTFVVVTKGDIAQVIAQLTPRLLKSEQAALTAQLQAGEQLLSPTCTPTNTADHHPGDQATHVKITVSAPCSAGAYNQQAVQAQGEQLLNAQARTGYRLAGDMHLTILAKQVAATMRVQFTGMYLYQINQQALTTLIAGQPRQYALLLRVTGVQHASIAGVADDTPLPLDPTRIHFQVFIGL